MVAATRDMLTVTGSNSGVITDPISAPSAIPPRERRAT